jgi:hypothetical protein
MYTQEITIKIAVLSCSIVVVFVFLVLAFVVLQAVSHSQAFGISTNACSNLAYIFLLPLSLHSIYHKCLL